MPSTRSRRSREVVAGLTCLVAALAGASIDPVGDTTKADQPNIVLFIVDDLGWQDISLALHHERTPLNERYRTPNVERLAASGMRFTNAYASAPVCTPTRTSIMTGMSPGRSRISYWTLHADRDTSANHPTLSAPKWNTRGLESDDITLPRLLREAGYTTIHAGKAHFSAHGASGSDPRNLGFEVNIAGHASGAPGSYYGVHHFANARRRGQDPSQASVWDVPGLEAYHDQEIYLTEALSIEVDKAVRAAVGDGGPFYLNFAPYAVHTPIMPNPALVAKYDDLAPTEAAYASMIESVDIALGKLLDLLEELGQIENTLVVFTSDNGGLSAHARGPGPTGERVHVHNAPLRSGKGSAYEGGVRVPTIIAWPGRVPADSVNHTPIVSHDLFPTLLHAGRASCPAEHWAQVEGQDLIAMMCDGKPLSARPIFFHQPHQWGAAGPGIEPFTALRLDRWKLVYFHTDRRFELFDLSADLGETTNLARHHPDALRDLASVMDGWIERADVQLSVDKATNAPIVLPGVAAEAFLRPSPAR